MKEAVIQGLQLWFPEKVQMVLASLGVIGTFVADAATADLGGLENLGLKGLLLLCVGWLVRLVLKMQTDHKAEMKEVNSTHKAEMREVIQQHKQEYRDRDEHITRELEKQTGALEEQTEAIKESTASVNKMNQHFEVLGKSLINKQLNAPALLQWRGDGVPPDVQVVDKER